MTVRTKAVLVAQMYNLGERPQEPLGPGSKEKKSAFIALGRFVGLDLSDVAGKAECGQRIAAVVGATWDEDCYSLGDSITTTGLTRLIDGAVDWHLAQPSPRYRFIKKALEVNSQSPDGQETQGTSVSENSEIETNLANYLAELSEFTETPIGIQNPNTPYPADELLSNPGLWRDALSSVQGWLSFSDTLLLDSSDEFDASVAYELNLPPTTSQEIFDTTLLGRLEIAVEYAHKFVEELEGAVEGSATRATATQTWKERWSEYLDERDLEAESNVPINAIARTWPITEFVEFASDKSLNLSPSYQRADVWPNADAQSLIESVLRGIPLPSVILLQNDTEDGVSYEVVDGKQRLTSILRFIGKHPSALRTVAALSKKWEEPELSEIFQTDYPQFKKLWRKHEYETLSATKEKTLYFPFKLRKSADSGLKAQLEHLQGKYYCEISENKIQIVGEKRKVAYIFRNQSDYQIPVIIYKDASSEQVHEVFSLYNKQGKHLNAEEIRNALYHRLPLMRALLLTSGDTTDVEEVAPFLSDVWDGVQPTGEFLEQLGFGKAGFKRTKLLSWVASVLFYTDGRAGTGSRSTAAQINAFLKSVRDSGQRSPFAKEPVVQEAMLVLNQGINTLATVGDEIWDPSFKHAQGGAKWQELQLVAVLIAFCAASVIYDEKSLITRVESRFNEVRLKSQTWIRPEKTQTKAQWIFIAKVVDELLEALQISPTALEEALKAKFGASGLTSLLKIVAPDDPQAA